MAIHYLAEAIFTVVVFLGFPAVAVLAGDCIRKAHRDIHRPD